MYIHYNENPTGRTVGDCAVRAVSVALGIPWEKAYMLMAVNGFMMGDMPAANSVWGSVLRQNGFRMRTLPESCPACYTAEDFAADHPDGIYVLGFGTHTATIKDGNLYDAWDSSQEVPQYYWYKPTE